MSGRLPRVTAREIARVLESKGFSVVRTSGSHALYKNAAGKRITLPVHAGRTLHPKIVQSILRDAEMSADELRSAL